MIYFDTSALVKRYVSEEGSDAVDQWFAGTPLIATSKLTYPEMLSALNRRHKEGAYSRKWLDKMIDNFESDWELCYVIDMPDNILAAAKRLILKYSLRGADSVHLASALLLRERVGGNVALAASDSALLEAASSEGLAGIDPRYPDRR